MPDQISLGITGWDNIINSSHGAQRMTWLLLIAFASGLMIYHLNKRISSFLEYPTSVKITMQKPAELSFPIVTVCNFDFRRTAESIVNRTHDKRTGKMLYPMILAVKWEMKEALEEKEYTMTVYRTCYVFNRDKRKTAKIQGQYSALELILNVQSDLQNADVLLKGFLVQLTNHDGEQKWMTNPVHIRPGTGQFIGVKRKDYRFLEAPYMSNCTYRAKSQQDCLWSCIAIMTTKLCGCRAEEAWPHVPGYSICNDSIPDFLCWREMASLYKKVPKECDCPTPCNLTEYTTTVSGEEFVYAEDKLSPMYEILKKYPMSREFMRENVAYVNIHFESLQYMEIEEQPAFTWLSLLSEVGGALGLGLGCSLLTVAQVVELIVVYVANSKRPCRKADKAVLSTGVQKHGEGKHG